MTSEDIYNEAWQQFIHAGVEISFTDWLIDHMTEVRAEFQRRMDSLLGRVAVMERQYVPRERIEMLERENQALQQQLHFERQRNAAPPDLGHARAEPGTTPAIDINYTAYNDPRGGLDPVREQRRLEDIRRQLEQFTRRPQDSDSG